jgi:hypothetical protein
MSPQEFSKPRLRWWWWLLLVNLLVRLQMIEHLTHCFHQLILHCYKLLQLLAVVAIVGLVVAGLAVALIIPRVHHVRDFF